MCLIGVALHVIQGSYLYDRDIVAYPKHCFNRKVAILVDLVFAYRAVDLGP